MARGTEKRAAADALLLHGEERFLVDERARATLDQWGKDLVSDFGLDTMEGAGLAPVWIQDAVLQAPFLDPYRVVFVRMLPGNRAEGLVAAVAEIPPTTRLLVTVAGRISSANKLAKAITAAGGKVEETQHLNRRSLSEWAAKRAVEKHGLTPAVAAQVVRVSPPDLSIVDSELTKLAAYKASGAKLTPDAIAELLAGGREDDMSEHRFVIQKAFDAAQSANPDRLERALKQIRDYEWEVKSGQLDAELGLDVLLTRL